MSKYKVGDPLICDDKLGVISKVINNLYLYPYRPTYQVDWIDSSLVVAGNTYDEGAIHRWSSKYKERIGQNG